LWSLVTTISFGHYPKLCSPAHFPLHHNGPVQRLHYCRCRPKPSVHLQLHFTLTPKQDPEILELPRLVCNSLPGRREHSNIFQQRTMASDLELLTLIPTASHSAANYPVRAGGHGLSPNSTLSSPRLCLEILSMKDTNRIGDKGQPWRSHTRACLFQEYGHSFHFGCTRTGWLVTMAQVPHTPAVPPTGFPRGHVHSPQNTCRLDGQTTITPTTTL